VTKAEGFFLARVADLNHFTDAANKADLIVLALFDEEAFESGRIVEVIFDGILTFAGDDNNVLDAGGDALFGDVLNLWLVDNDKHFLGLRFGGREKTGTEASGGKNRFANFALGHGICSGRNGSLGHKRVCSSHSRGKLSYKSTVAAALEVCQSIEARMLRDKHWPGSLPQRFPAMTLGR